MTTIGAPGRRRGTAVLAAVLALVVVAGCVADPPPPTVVGEERSDGEAVSLSAGGVLLALDRVDGGFNPHLLADQGVDTDLVASLLLPSAFGPGPGGAPVLNRDLLVSAEPLPGDPRTVRYTIDHQAQWSDGVPVAAEDFEYLWRQMTTQPGVVDPAGYERIVAVRAGAGGKVVDVEFDSPPEHWQTLFSHLLPGHILKDAPDGFQGAMASLPVMSAGPFMIRVADIGRGEIELVRNDRYWAGVPGPDQIIVRRATGTGQLGAALRGGAGSLSMVAATPVAGDVARTVPGVRSLSVDAAIQLELGFNTVAPAVDDPAVRRAVAAAVDPEVVARIVTGEADPSVTPFPFPPSSHATTTGDAAAVQRSLTGAGFTRVGDRWERDGTPLSVTLGVEAEDDRALTAAYTVADQLRGAGIGARVWELDPVALYGDALPHGLVDAVVGWQRVDGRAEVAAVSRFACAPATSPDARDRTTLSRPPTTVTTLVPPEPDTGITTTPESTGTTSSTTTSSPPRTIGTSAPARASGVSGVCDPALDRALDSSTGSSSGSAIRPGDSPAEPDLAAAGDLVADLALRVPLVRPGLLFSGVGVDGIGTEVPRPGRIDPAPPMVTEVFDTAPNWRRTG